MLLVLAMFGGADGGSDNAAGDGSADVFTGDAALDGVTDSRLRGTSDDGQAALPEREPTRQVASVAIEGEVFQRGTRRRLRGAEVLLDGVATTMTDAEGRFQIVIPPGPHQIRVIAAAFEPSQVIVGRPRVPKSLVFRLDERETPNQYETVVRANHVQAPAFHLQQQELTRVPGALGDPFRAIETLPGVSTVAWPLPIYAIRGTNPGNTGYFIDDIRVPALFHFALGPAVVHPYLIDSLDFYPGGYPARYGRYVGGTVVASTHSPPDDRAHLSVDVRLFDVGIMASMSFDHGRGTVTISGRYSYTATLLSLFNSDLDLSYSDAQVRIEHALGRGRLTFLAFGSTDALDSKAPTNTQDHLHMRFARASLKYQAPLGPGRFGASLGGGLDSSRAPLDNGSLSSALNSTLDSTLSVRSYSTQDRVWYRMGATRVVDTEVGFDEETTWYGQAESVSNPAVGDLAHARRALLSGGYVALTLHLGERLVLVPAFREDVYNEGNATTSSPGPRLSGKVRLRDGLWVNATIGHYSQLPSLPVQLSGFESFGLSEYGLQTAWQSSLGIEARLPLDLSLEATTFLQRSVLTDVRDPNSGDYLLDDYLVRRQALAYGAEFLLRRPLNARLYGWLSYTLSRSLRLFESGNVGPSSWDQTHVINLVVGYRSGPWILGTRAHFNTGRPTQISGTLPVEESRLPPYYQIDLRAERRYVLDRYVLTAYVEFLNATLSRNVTGLSQDATGIRQSGYTIAIPSVGVRGEF